VPETASGRKARCPQCRRVFLVPRPDELFEETISTWIEEDVEQGRMHIDLVDAFNGNGDVPVDEVTLAKLEYVLEQDSMPPGRFTMMHWNKALSEDEKATMRSWIETMRETHFAARNVAAEFKTEAVQPLSAPEGLHPAKVALGDALFHDVRLSGDESLSCASCHALDKGGTDQRRTSTGIDGQVGPINSPTVYNAVFAVKQFWDGRAEDLQEQAAGPVHNPIEMGSSWDEVIPRLEADEALTRKFTEVYPEGWTGENITNAIAEFEKSLVTVNSRFDQYLRGDEDALTAEEKQGYALFKEVGCTSCHVGPAVGQRSFERMGLKDDYFADRGDVAEVDLGRYNVTKLEEDRHRFKVPTLRNIEVTYPYFHDGSKTDLAAAVKDMAHYQRERKLTEKETAALVAFLHTLTGEYDGQRLDEMASEN